MYFATGMLWNQALQPLQVMSTAPSPPNSLPYPCRPIGSASFASCDYDAATPGGERVFGFDWVAPVTGNFLVSVRTFLREGAANGNYSMAYGSDWVDLCVTQSVSCGDERVLTAVRLVDGYERLFLEDDCPSGPRLGASTDENTKTLAQCMAACDADSFCFAFDSANCTSASWVNDAASPSPPLFCWSP